ncbi:MAG: hypothetical protein AB1726_01365 [Planctomycetota bacterium]
MRRSAPALLALLLGSLALWAWWHGGSPVSDLPEPQATAVEPEAPTSRLAPPGGPGDRETDTRRGRSAVLVPDLPPAAASVRGRLLDRETGEPVPWYLLGVSMGGEGGCVVETDAEGRFATPVPYPAGMLTLDLWDVTGQELPADGADRTTRMEHDPAGPELDVAIPVGPTYSLELSLPDGLGRSEVRARLYVDPPAHREAGDTPWSRTPTTLLRDRPDASRSPWVRFRGLLVPAQDPLWLSVESRDGMWRGGARVGGGPGVHPERVRITLHERCAVVGRFVSVDPIEGGGAQIALLPGTEGAPPLVWAHAGVQGGFRIDDLEPGAYRLEVRDEAVTATPVCFTIVEGVLDLGELPWEPIPLAGPVRLRLRSAAYVPIDVQLVRTLDPPRHPLWHSDEWEELPDGRYESVFAWEQVYAGDYAIEVHGHGDVSWHLPLGHLVPPVENLLLELPAPAEPVRFDVRAEDGSELDRWELWARGERVWEMLEPVDGQIAAFAFDDDFQCAVWSPGRRAWRGSGRPPSPGERTIPIRLPSGWSRLFVVKNRDGWQGVPGAELWLDGTPAGTTDARGELYVEWGAAPTDWEVRHSTLVGAESGSKGAGEELEEFVVGVTLRPR